jgi:hypothetical protein
MPKQCEQLKVNLAQCNCTYQGCSRKGNCCACIQYHLNMRELPACAFPPDVEKTYDRTFERFIETHR